MFSASGQIKNLTGLLFAPPYSFHEPATELVALENRVCQKSLSYEHSNKLTSQSKHNESEKQYSNPSRLKNITGKISA